MLLNALLDTVLILIQMEMLAYLQPPHVLLPLPLCPHFISFHAVKFCKFYIVLFDKYNELFPDQRVKEF